MPHLVDSALRMVPFDASNEGRSDVVGQGGAAGPVDPPR
jgi:hypothetical protein